MENCRNFSKIPVKELPPCPVETTLMLISDRWKVLILRDLMPGTKRFGELKKSIGHAKDKRSGITYVYESVSYWDSEKKQSRSHRKLVGRLDPVSGAIIPTDGRGRNRKQKPSQASDIM